MTRGLLLGVATLALVASGCLPHVDETRIYDERPIGSSRSVDERQEPPPDITSSVSDNAVHVTAVQRTECRTTTTTPIEKEEGTGHSLHNGTMAQGLNLAMAGALIAGGIAIYAAANSSSCTTTPNATPGNPNPSPVPCTPDQQQTQTAQTRGLGVLTAGAAILPLGAFVWNIFRAKDDTKTEQSSPRVASTDWKTCATQPLANAPVTLYAGSVTLNGRTDERGEATLDLSPVASAATDGTDPQNGTIHVDVGGKQASGSVSLSGSPAYLAWKQARLAAASAASAEAWARARKDEAASESAALDRIEPDLSALERKGEPWGDAEIQRVQSVYAVLKELTDRQEGRPSSNPRVVQDDARLRQLDAKFERALALAKQREQQRAASEARQRALAEKQLLPVCIDCCLKSFAAATRDHCEAACRSDPHSYATYGWPTGQAAFVLGAMGIPPPKFSCTQP